MTEKYRATKVILIADGGNIPTNVDISLGNWNRGGGTREVFRVSLYEALQIRAALNELFENI